MAPLRQSKLSFNPISGSVAFSSSPTKSKPTVIRQEAEGKTEHDLPMDPLESSSATKNKIRITDKVGAIFDAPDNTLIIHACNCLGSWRAGIAAAFHQRYPKAYSVYKDHCENNTPAFLIGTALLIPPVESGGPRHFVGCLFTSKKYGKGKDSPEEILGNTKFAMEDLIKIMGKQGGIGEIRMCQINSGLFAVPWEKSRSVIESLEASEVDDIPKEIVVYSMPSRK